jgi:uncharacterized protein YjbI with pentapeptide repeats
MKPIQHSEAPTPVAGGDADGLDRTLADHALWVASEGREGRRADLTNADLSGVSLAGRNLSRAVLIGADLSGADLSEAVLDGARMIRVRLVGADLLGASMVETNLTWANLKNARLASAILRGACLADSDLTGARLRGADFTNADLEGADLRGAELAGTVMNGTDLTGTLLDGPAGDAHIDAAYEAEAVLDSHHEPLTVSELPDADLEDHHGPEPAALAAHAAPGEPEAEPAPGRADALAAILAAHGRWLATGGAQGRRADLGRLDLRGLSLAGADLSGADLATARFLTAPQLAGADLTGARLPEAVGRFPDLERVRGLATMARRLLVTLVLTCLYTLMVIAADAGHSLAGGMAALRLPMLDVVVPVFWFHLGAPLAVLALYGWLHVYLVRMFEALGRLPAVFPDGTPLDRRADPWLVAGLVHAHVPRLKARRPPLWWAQQALVVAVAWGAAPATLIFLWGAYAPRGGIPAAAYQAAVACAAFAFGLYTRLLVRRALRNAAP